MTLLTTISNIGSSWPNTLSLYLVDFFSINNCTYDASTKSTIDDNISDILEKIENNSCSSESQINQCKLLGGKCSVYLDAYYLIAIACGFFGFFWIWSYRNQIWSLHSSQKSSWSIRLKNPKKETIHESLINF